jgi:hypothetical protein
VAAEIVKLVVFDAPKEAVPVGTVAGVQFPPVLKSPVPGEVSQVAFWALAAWAENQMPASNAAALQHAREDLTGPVFLNRLALLEAAVAVPRRTNGRTSPTLTRRTPDHPRLNRTSDCPRKIGRPDHVCFCPPSDRADLVANTHAQRHANASR